MFLLYIEQLCKANVKNQQHHRILSVVATMLFLSLLLVYEEAKAEPQTIILFKASKIEDELRKRLPTTINADGIRINLIYPPSLLDLCSSSGRISLKFDFKAKTNVWKTIPVSASGDAKVSFGLRLGAGNKAIYLHNLRLDNLNVDGLNPKLDGLLTRALARGLNRAARKSPIYSFGSMVEEISQNISIKAGCQGIGLVYVPPQ